MTEKRPNLFQEVAASLGAIMAIPPSAAAAHIELDSAIAELRVVTAGGYTAPMIRELSELAKMGLGPNDMRRIRQAVEHNQIIAFETGQIRLVGSSRTLRQIHEEDAR